MASVKAMKDKLTLLKLVITAALLFFVLSKVDAEASLDTLRYVRMVPFILALGTAVLEYPVKAIRWQLLLRTIGIRVSVNQLISYMLVGRFFNLFMPGTTGGDLVRIRDIAESQAEGRISAGTTVIADRVFGVVAIFVTGGIALFFEQDSVIDAANNQILAIAVLSVTGFLAVIFANRLIEPNRVSLDSLVPRPVLVLLERFSLAARLSSLVQSFETLIRDRATTLKALLLSCVAQLVSVCFLFLTLRSLGAEVHLLGLVPILSIIMLILLLPISIQGIGVRESLYIHFLGQKGVASDVVLSALAIRYGVMIVPGVIGGIIFALRRRSQA